MMYLCISLLISIYLSIYLAQAARAAEYTESISAERQDSANKDPVSDAKQSDGEASVILELWGMQSTPSLPWFPGSFSLGVIISEKVLSIGKIEQ